MSATKLAKGCVQVSAAVAVTSDGLEFLFKNTTATFSI